MAALGVDVIGLGSPVTMFGFRNEGWKPWTTFDGTPMLVPERFSASIPAPRQIAFCYTNLTTTVDHGIIISE
jgi:hypothetical protein